jgi:hypothetical protein
MKNTMVVLLVLTVGLVKVSQGQAVSADYVKFDSSAAAPAAQAGFGFLYSDGVTGLFHRRVTETQKLLKDSRTLTLTGTANEITVTNQDLPINDLSVNRTWLFQLPATIDLGGKTSFELPNGASPTTDAFGEIAGDNNAWGTNRGVVQFFDGTSNTYLVGVLASDVPSDNQFPRFKANTITWELLETTDIPATLGATTFRGKLQFTNSAGTHVGLDVNSLTSSQQDGLTLDNGNIWYNSDLHKFRGYRNGSKRDFIMSGDGLGVNFQAGEIVVGATANDSVRGVVKQNYGRLVSTTTGDATWLTPSTGWRIDEDWISWTISGNNRWRNFQIGGGSVALATRNDDQNHPGIVRLSTGSAASTDYAGVQLGTSSLRFDGGTIVFEALVYIQAVQAWRCGGGVPLRSIGTGWSLL